MEQQITEFINNAGTNREARAKADQLISMVEESRDAFIDKHCEESGELINNCDCFECSRIRNEIMAEMNYDSIRHGGY